MIYRRLKRKRFGKLKRILLTTAAIFTVVIVFCEHQIADFKSEYIRIQAEIVSVNSVCDAVNECIKSLGYEYGDIVKIDYSDSGEVQAVTTDSFVINELKTEIMKAVQEKIAKVYDNEISVPLGAFTGITVLSNLGPELTISFNLTGSFSSDIVSSFETAGINQTVHHITLELTSKIMTTSLDYSGNMTFSTDFEIAQTVIVGDIPTAYGSICGK